MENDLVDNYAIQLNGYKRYKCELCDYITSQKKDISEHILRKKHRENYKIKHNITLKTTPTPPPILIKSTTPIPINDNDNNINLVISSIGSSPPKNKLKGKTFLSMYCNEAIKIDTSLPYLDHFVRNLELNDNDISKFRCFETNEYLLYFFNKLIKEFGINNLPIRCVDKNRKRFFYNDFNIGWTEDILNEQTLKFIRHIISISNMTLIKFGG